MREIIAFFEGLLQPILLWWNAGGRAAAVAVVTSAPFATALGFVFRLILRRHADKRRENRRIEAENEARKLAAADDMTAIVEGKTKNEHA